MLAEDIVPFLLRFRTSLNDAKTNHHEGPDLVSPSPDEALTGNRATKKTAVHAESTDDD